MTEPRGLLPVSLPVSLPVTLLVSLLVGVAPAGCGGPAHPAASGSEHAAKQSSDSAGTATTPALATPTATTAEPTTAEPSTPEAEPLDPLPLPPDGPHPFGARDLIALDRLGEHALSPDGKTVVYVLRTLDHGTGKSRTDLWSVSTDGGDPSQLTDDEHADGNPRWSKDGKTLYFISSRGGTSQVWRMPAGGGTPEAVTELPLPVANLQLSPTGDRLALTMDVFVDCEDLACTAERLKEDQRDPSTGRGYDEGFVRHWDHYRDGRRSHLFTLSIGESGDEPSGEPIDLTHGQDADVPSQPFGGPEEYAFSPDGGTVVYTARDVGASERWSTDFDLYAVAADGRGERRELTTDNPAWDTRPVFAPDGKTLAFVAMSTPGYEADRFAITLMSWPEGELRTLADDWDRSVDELSFAPDGASLLVTAQHLGQKAMFRVALADGAVTELLADGSASGPQQAAGRIVLARDDLRHPADLWIMAATGGAPVQLTQLNADRLSDVAMGEPAQFTFAGFRGETVHGYVVAPAERREGERHPVAFLIHGGPQGSFGNHFHYRWNPQTYAGAGFGVVMIDFHGSTGYGQAFTDSIQGDWGGKPLVDLQKGLEAALERYAWLDGDRVCALGASYGGFMINWIAGRWPDRFRCLVNHDGVFDQRAMYYTTEELWFPEREHGAPQFRAPGAYDEHDPVRFVERWSTPMMVIHGSLDFRVPETQGLAAFTALQRRGIPSRYLHFPDENHWVLKPANTLQWHAEVEGWLSRWLREIPGGDSNE